MSRLFNVLFLSLVLVCCAPVCSIAQNPYLAVADSDSASVPRFDATTGLLIDVLQPLDANGQSILAQPMDVNFGPDGNLYVLDHQNPFVPFPLKRGSVLKFDGRTGMFMGIFALGEGVGPQGLTFGPDGNLYVSDQALSLGIGGQVLRYDGKTGAFMDIFIPCCVLSDPIGLTFGPDGNLYVTSISQILRFDGKTGAFIDVFATFTGPGRALIFGPDGNLYVSVLNGESEVLQFDGKTGTFMGPFVGAGTGGLDCPWGLAFGPDKNLYVASPQCGHAIGTREGNQHGILRFGGPLDPSPGAFIDVFVDSNNGALSRAPAGMAFSPSCPVNVNLSANGPNMFAQFTPSNGLTLVQAEKACGFAGFNWQQTITNWPAPSASRLRARDPSLIPQNILPDGSFVAPPAVNDPPPGGWTYQPDGYNPFPFSYPLSLVLSQEQFPTNACVFFSLTGCAVPLVSPDDKTLSFRDGPSDPCLPGGNPILQELLLCGTGAPQGSFLGFTTSLVGVQQGGIASPPLFQWTWISTFNGTSGGVATTSNDQPIDPGSGTGGVIITSINGIPQTPPSITCIATPNILWPPNGKLISVTISGSIMAGTSPLASNTTSFSVADSEQQIQSSGTITLASDGSYSFAVSLPAAREGADKNGRQYGISVQSGDQIGNQALCLAVVSVPHDQGH